MGPSSQISKILLILLLLVILFFIWTDYQLYLRIQNYPRDRDMSENHTSSYSKVTWIGCDISPLCGVTTKALLLDHINYYLYSPFATIIDKALKISEIGWITPNMISFFHIFVAILSAKCVSSDNLAYRRIGVVLFEFRTFLDDLDGHVARARKHIRGERSETGTSGYYIDGLCDTVGCIALLVGCFIFLKNNPPRRGYSQLPTVAPSESKDREPALIYKAKITTNKIIRLICLFTIQLVINSLAWNRYIALYQDLLERNDVSREIYSRQNIIFKSSFFLSVTWLWRLINVHNMFHFMLLSIFCDKLWEFVQSIVYIGYAVLLSVICISEMHLSDIQSFIFKDQTSNTTNY